MSSTAESWFSDAELLVPGLRRIVKAVWKSSLRIGAFRGASSKRRWWPEKSFRSSNACWVKRMRFCASCSCRESACIEIWRGKTGRQAYEPWRVSWGSTRQCLGDRITIPCRQPTSACYPEANQRDIWLLFSTKKAHRAEARLARKITRHRIAV